MATGSQDRTCRADDIEFYDGAILDSDCLIFGTVQGRQLNLEERFALATKPKRGCRNKWHEHDPTKGTRTGHHGT